MRLAIFLTIFCLLFTAGCVSSRAQHNNIVTAMNDRPVLVGYSKAYLIETYGPPDSKTVSKPDGVRTEKWIYKTRFGRSYSLVNVKPLKPRYMKLTVVDNRVLSADFE